MPSPLVIMDYQHSLRLYLRDNNLPEPGPLVMSDEELIVRHASRAMHKELKHEKCYTERLWLEVGDGWTGKPGEPPGGGGGGALLAMDPSAVSSQSISGGAI